MIVITGGDRGVGGQTAELNWCQDHLPSFYYNTIMRFVITTFYKKRIHFSKKKNF